MFKAPNLGIAILVFFQHFDAARPVIQNENFAELPGAQERRVS
jgi:hypothetical protein